MKEKEKATLSNISNSIKKLDPMNLNYVAGVLDGMAIQKENEERSKKQ